MKPDKPGFVNRCPACSEPEQTDLAPKPRTDVGGGKNESELNQARKHAIRDLLYRKDS